MNNYFIFFILISLLIPFNAVSAQLTFSEIINSKEDNILELNRLVEIALDDEGKIFVADFRNNRIQILDSSGDFHSLINTAGRPHGIEVYNEKVYVANWENPQIEIFWINGSKINSFFGPQQPADVTIEESGKIFVTDYNMGGIHIFDSKGNLEKEISVPVASNGNTAKLTGITLDSSKNIYVTDYLNNRVIKLDSSGNFLFEFHVPFEEGGEFVSPTNIEMSKNGGVFVTDNSDRILIFDSNGNFLDAFGESGKEQGQFIEPHGIAFNNFGQAYVAEFAGNRIQIFNLDESFQISEKNHNILNQTKENDELYDYIYLIVPLIIFVVGVSILLKKYVYKKQT